MLATVLQRERKGRMGGREGENRRMLEKGKKKSE
jgi:hypothetical protein